MRNMHDFLSPTPFPGCTSLGVGVGPCTPTRPQEAGGWTACVQLALVSGRTVEVRIEVGKASGPKPHPSQTRSNLLCLAQALHCMAGVEATPAYGGKRRTWAEAAMGLVLGTPQPTHTHSTSSGLYRRQVEGPPTGPWGQTKTGASAGRHTWVRIPVPPVFSCLTCFHPLLLRL